MLKYIVGLIIIVIGVFVLEFLMVIDIPYVNLPDITIARQEVVEKTEPIYYKIN
jgi:hypothetical protein